MSSTKSNSADVSLNSRGDGNRLSAFRRRYDLHGDTLAFDERRHTCLRNDGVVDKDVLQSIVSDDEAKRFLEIEPLDCTRHRDRR